MGVEKPQQQSLESSQNAATQLAATGMMRRYVHGSIWDDGELANEMDRKFRFILNCVVAHTIILLVLTVCVLTYKGARLRREGLKLGIELQNILAGIDTGDDAYNAQRGDEREVLPEELDPAEKQPEETTPEIKPEEKPDETQLALQDPGLGGGEEESEEASGGQKYSSREGDARKTALAKYGGSEHSEECVVAGLEWLQRHQSPRGFWDLDSYHSYCERGLRVCETNRQIFPVAIYDNGLTGLCLLAFLGRGCTHQNEKTPDNPFGNAVSQAVNYLLQQQGKDGCFQRWQELNIPFPLYDHALALFALSELYAMTKDPGLREPVERGVKFLVDAQQTAGGWDYSPNRTGRNDLSITGWALMALISARNSGIEIDDAVFRRTALFVTRAVNGKGEGVYADMEPQRGRTGIGMTAVSLYCRQLLGETGEGSVYQKQVAWLMDNLPNWSRLQEDDLHSMYYWYYGTLAMFNHGGKEWERWNLLMRDTLVEKQVRTESCLRGSWEPTRNQFGYFAGRVYSTAIGVLNLEVYYRYLPITQGLAAQPVEAGGGAAPLAYGEELTRIMNDLSLEVESLRSGGKPARSAAVRELKEFYEQTTDVTGRLTDQALLLSAERSRLLIDFFNLGNNTGDQYSALDVLRRAGPDEAVVPFCIDLLRQDNSIFTMAAVDVLRERKAFAAVPALAEQLTRPSSDRTRNESYEALKEITGEDLPPLKSRWTEWWEQHKNEAGE